MITHKHTARHILYDETHLALRREVLQAKLKARKRRRK